MKIFGMNIFVAQINPVLGDCAGNAALHLAAAQQAQAAGADLVVFSELSLVGYPPEDLILRPSFREAVQQQLIKLAQDAAHLPPMLLGAPYGTGALPYNAALLLQNGQVQLVATKQALPNYNTFDDKRVFAVGQASTPLELCGQKLGVLICEDVWVEAPAAYLAQQGATAFLVLNASPFHQAKLPERIAVAQQVCKVHHVPLLYVNQWGGQDELVFDGGSFALSAQGALCWQGPQWQDALTPLSLSAGQFTGTAARIDTDLAQLYQALLLGVRDYARKNNFRSALLGLSGGVDSALVAVLAADALGAAQVHAYMLPSPYTSVESHEDAAALAQALGCTYNSISIIGGMQALSQELAPFFAGKAADITEENMQSRLRGVLLMALSNKFGHLLLTTGNKSEYATGYATLYGDMCGGFAPIKDVYKTLLYQLCVWRNTHLPHGGLCDKLALIPPRILTKAPTAELKPNQTDQDSLPPYAELDAILQGLIEEEVSHATLVARGFTAATVQKVQDLVWRAEYKRRQAAPGTKITQRNFGRDRRYPITMRWRERAD